MPNEPSEQAQESPVPAKNIILLSDGTGNSAAKVWRTNVWRVFGSLALTNARQVAIYDDGVGSVSCKPLALLGGFSVDKMTWPMTVGIPLRRTLAQLWFKPIARIGATGNDEYPLDSVRRVGRDVLRRELVAELTARTTGEIFLYVNDAVIGLPGIADYFYVGRGKGSRNVGTAKIKVETVTSSTSP